MIISFEEAYVFFYSSVFEIESLALFFHPNFSQFSKYPIVFILSYKLKHIVFLSNPCFSMLLSLRKEEVKTMALIFYYPPKVPNFPILVLSLLNIY